MATETNQYLLSFNLDEVVNQISVLQDSYVNLGSELGKFSTQSSEKIDALEQRLKRASASLDASLLKFEGFFQNFNKRIKDSETVMQSLSKSSKEFLTNLNAIGASGATLDMKGGKAPTSSQIASSLGSPEKLDELKKAHVTAEATNQASKEAIGNAKKAEQEGKSAAKKIGEAIESEVKAVKGRLGGIMSGFSGGALAGGGLMALVGMMVLGFAEKQRKGAERGEMANAFEAMGENSTKAGKQAIGWFSRFQEYHQFRSGIGRQEIQGIVNQAAQAGLKLDEVMKGKLNKSINDVSANAVTATLALDKHLNKASGSSMKEATGLVEDYGYSIDKAAESYKLLAMEAQRSGANMDKFVTSVMAGSSSLKQYGVELGDVAETARILKKHYEGMGMNSQQAGAMAAQGVQDVTGFFSGMSKELQGLIAMDLYEKFEGNRADYTTAIQWFKERQLNLLKGDDKTANANFLLEGISSLDKYIGESDRNKWLYKVRAQMPGGGPQAAENLWALNQSIKEKGSVKGLLESMDETQIKDLNNSFKTEGQKLTEAQKNQRDLIDGLAKIGEGLLTIASGILSILIIGIRSLPSLIAGAVKAITSLGTDTGLLFRTGELVQNAVSKQWEYMKGGLGKLDEGFAQTQKAMGQAVTMVFGKGVGEAMDVKFQYQWSDLAKAVTDLANSDVKQEALLNELTNEVANIAQLAIGGWAEGVPVLEYNPGNLLAGVIRDKMKQSEGYNQAQLDREAYGKDVRMRADAAIEAAKRGEKISFTGPNADLQMYKTEIEAAYNASQVRSALEKGATVP